MPLLRQIWVYPIKSIAGLPINASKLEKRGLEFDRRWMLIDQDNQFITQRQNPEMALIEVLPDMDFRYIKLQHKRKKLAPLTLQLAAPQNSINEKLMVTIWNDNCPAYPVGQEFDDWFSRALNRPCRLVYMPDSANRQVSQKYAMPSDQVSFADGFPYLITNTNSLEDLNQRMAAPVSMLRFRPNFIISGLNPWEEDQWKGFKIGSHTFRSLKPCARCQLLTVDPHTAEVGKEPLKTLSTFRRKENKVLFGMNACWALEEANANNLIKVGDEFQAWT